MGVKKFGINYPMVLRVIGWLLMIEAGFLLFPVATCFIYCENNDLEAFAISAAVTFASGCAMTFGIRPARHEMAKREGFLLTACVWIFFTIFGMLPFMLTETPL